MPARRFLWVFGVLLSLLPLAALRAPVAAHDRAAAPAAVPFPHGKHVPSEWLTREEVARDCRGCHQYDVDPAVEANLPQPEATCAKCHYPVNGRPSVQVSGTLAATKAAKQDFQTFVHGDHLGMDCKACHVDPANRSSTVPDDMWVPSGTGLCLKCHDESTKSSAPAPLRKWVDAANADNGGARFAAALNAHPGMRKSGKAVFKHSDHLDPRDMSDGARCDECHQSMSGAGANIGEAVFATTDCGKCHLEAGGAALNVETESNELTSRSDLTFLHSDHLSAEALATGRIKAEGCFACHDYAAGGVTHTYPVKPELENYDGCVRCHDADGVKGRAGTTRWGVADDLPSGHGDVGHAEGDQRTCNKCHVIGDFDAPLKTARPGREVDRRRPQLFTITEQVHPHMTGSKEVKNKKCADCHLAEVDRIPSRIRGVAFDHDSHLGKDATPADCLKCHVAQSAKLGGMMQADAPDIGALTYDELSCRECHRGIERDDQRFRAAGYEPVNHPVAIFDHNDHLTKDGKPLHACGDCHVPVPPAEREAVGRQFSEPEDVLNCVKCHNHGEGYEACDGAGQEYVNSCVDCHEVHTKGLPEPGRAYPIAWPRVASLSGTQFHPRPSDTRCSDCHRTRPESIAPQAGLVTCDSAFAGANGEDIHKQSNYPPACYACHWGDPQNVSSANVGQFLIEGSFQKNTRGRIPTSRLRNLLGGQIKNYPGGPGR